MAFGTGVVAAQLRAHIDECGHRYEASREAIRDAKADLTGEITRLRSEQAAMDERNQKAILEAKQSIRGVFKLLLSVAGGVAMVFATALGILLKAQLHIPG